MDNTARENNYNEPSMTNIVLEAPVQAQVKGDVKSFRKYGLLSLVVSTPILAPNFGVTPMLRISSLNTTILISTPIEISRSAETEELVNEVGLSDLISPQSLSQCVLVVFEVANDTSPLNVTNNFGSTSIRNIFANAGDNTGILTAPNENSPDISP